MRKLILLAVLLVFLCLFLPSVSNGAVTLVQAVTGGSASADTVTKSYVNTPGQGNLLIAYGKGTTAATNASISGWTKVVTSQCGTAVWSALFYKVAGASETKDVVIVWTSSTSTSLRIGEWTGLSNPVVDQVAYSDYTGSVTSKTSGTTPTTTAAEELCIAVFFMSGTQGASVSWTNSFAEEYHGNNDEMGSLVTAGTWAAETTYTWTTARNCGGLIGTFKSGLTPTTYYVSQAYGNDTYNGLYPTYQGGTDGPKLTIGSMDGGVLSAGDTLQIRTGTYQQVIAFTSNGTAANRITITNYNGEAVVIDGGYTLPGGSVYNFLVTVSGDYVTLRNITVRRSSGSLLALAGDYSYAINVTGNGSREAGLLATGAYNLFDGCTMTDNGNGYGINGQGTWGGALGTVGSNTTIQNCISYDNKGEGINPGGAATNAIVQDNIVYDNDAIQIYLDSSSGIIVRRNLIYCSVGARYGPSSAIAIGGEVGEPDNLHIVNNFCIGNWINLVTDSNVETADNWIIAYNTFVNTQKTAGEIAAGYNMGVYFRPQLVNFVNSIFKNNIIVEEASNQVPINTSLTNSHAGFTFSNNCWNKTHTSAATGPGDVIGDPLLAKTGPTGPGLLTPAYFKILGTSPAIGYGIYDASVLTDYFETVRKTGTSPNGPDMGGYEYVTGGGPPPIYYVDSSITDTYVGSATPDFATYNHLTFETTGGSDWVYKTIADINACTFLPDDFIYFRKGQTWKERLLVPSSGTSGHPITIGAFGTGAAPQILGYCEWTSTGNWTEESSNIWYAAITPDPTGTLTNMVAYFGGLRGVSESAKGNLNAAYEWWYDSGTPKRLYVYSTSNPYTAYATIRCHIHQKTIDINAKSYWKFVGLHIKGPISYGAYDASGTTGIEFYYCLFDGVYGSTTTKAHTGLGSASGATNYTIANCDFIRWVNAISIAHTSGTTTVKNCRIYGFQNYGIYASNTGIVTASYNHVMGWPPTSGIYNWTNNSAYYQVTDGGNNISNGAAPEVVNLGGYVPRFMISVDGMGYPAVETYVHDKILPALDSQSPPLKMTMPVISCTLDSSLVDQNGNMYYPNWETEKNLIAGWKAEGHEVQSHSYSHQDWDLLNAIKILYTGSGTCTMTIAGNALQTYVNSVLDLNIDLTAPNRAALKALSAYIDLQTYYTSSLHANVTGNKVHSKCLADVTSQDIKTSEYTALLDYTRLVTSECADSKTVLDAVFSQTTTSFSCPYGHDSSSSWPIQQTYYISSRCGDADMLNTAENGINVQSMDGVDIGVIAGKTTTQIETFAREVFVWSAIWGRPQSLTSHPEDTIEPGEYDIFFSALLSLGAVFGTQSEHAAWVKAGTNIYDTFWARIPTEGDVDWTHLGGDQTINAGTNLGFTQDYLGNPMVGIPDIGIFEYQTPGTGTYYVDSSAADDGGVGSIGDPFKTIGHAINVTSAAGDIVYLKRGGVWRETLTIKTSGDASHQQIWGAYGSGDRPRIYGSTPITNWTQQSGNKWKAYHTNTINQSWFLLTSGAIIRGDTKTYVDLSELVNEYDWCYDATGDILYIYVANGQDPNTYYSGVEASIRLYGIYETGKSYVTLDNIEVRYPYGEGICIYRGGGHDWNITNCTVQHIGLGWNVSHGRGINIDTTYNTLVQSCTVHDCGTAGIVARSASPTGAATNIIVEHNTVTNCYHTCLDWLRHATSNPEMSGECRYNFVNYDSDYDPSLAPGESDGIFLSGSVGYVMSGIKVHHNIILNNPSFAILISDYCSGIEIYNNTCYGTRDTPSYSNGIATGTNTGATVTGLKIKNNIASTLQTYAFCLNFAGQIAECDYNCWYNPTGTAYTKHGAGHFWHSDDFAAYKTDIQADLAGAEAHSLWADPKFVNAGGSSAADYKLASNSPCINAGADVGLTEDYAGNPIIGLPDIGAYEYQLADVVILDPIMVGPAGSVILTVIKYPYKR